MAKLKIGSRTLEASQARVVREADRMFKLSPARRAHRLERAKAALADGGKGGKNAAAQDARPATKRAVAIVLSQGVAEL